MINKRYIIFAVIAVILAMIGIFFWKFYFYKNPEQIIPFIPLAEEKREFQPDADIPKQKTNPFEVKTNPFERVETNPFKDVYKNPFER